MFSDPESKIFPHELFILIIEAAKDDHSTLLNLCLVSRSFLSASQRCLYGRVSLGGIKVKTTGSGKPRWSIFDTQNDLTFFKVLTTNPRLAYYVHDFSFRPDTGNTNEQFCDLFHRALHNMVNLKYFQLTLMTSAGSFFQLLDGLCDQPFQLKAFSWKDYRRKISDRDGSSFLSFLASQPHLQALDVLSSPAPLVLPAESCPSLTTFIGNSTLARSAQQDRPISNFVWMGDQVEPPPLVNLDWSANFSKLRVLIFYDDFPSSLDMTGLVDGLQSLEVLQFSFDGSTAPSDNALNKATEFLAHIPQLKSLQMLSWIGAHPILWHNHSIQWVEGFKAAATSFFDHPRIRLIYFWYPSSRLRERYLYWAGDEPGKRSFVEVDSGELTNSLTSFGFDSSLIDRRFIYGQ